MIIHVISPGWDCQQWLEMHCASVDMQQGDIKVNHVLVDDGNWGAFAKDKKIHVNYQRMWGVFSRWRWCNPADEDLVVMLDMDDWFIHPQALDILAKTAQDGAWCIFARYTNGKDVKGPPGRKLSQSDPRKLPWRWFSHVRAVRGHLWNRINPKDYIQEDGTWYKAAADRFLLYPCMDMAGPKRIAFIDHILMFYNTTNSIHKTGQGEMQRYCKQKAQEMRRYKRL